MRFERGDIITNGSSQIFIDDVSKCGDIPTYEIVIIKGGWVGKDKYKQWESAEVYPKFFIQEGNWRNGGFEEDNFIKVENRPHYLKILKLRKVL